MRKKSVTEPIRKAKRTFSFDQGNKKREISKYKPQKIVKYKDYRLRKKMLRISFILVGVLCLILTIFSGVQVYVFNKNLESQVTKLGEQCKPFNPEPLQSIVEIRITDTNTVSSIKTNVYTSDQVVSIDFTTTNFAIDNGGTIGTFNDYIKLNNLYLNYDKIFSNISNVFLKVFFLKVNYIIISDEKFGMIEYSTQNNKSYLSKALAIEKTTGVLKTNICLDTWQSFIEHYSKPIRLGKTTKWYSNFILSDFLNFTNLQKEQIRIHINNSSGVDGIGAYFQRLLKNYGLDVVKNDSSNTTQLKSKILFADEKIKDSSSLKQIRYLVDDVSTQYQVGSKENIYADIYIDIGSDFVIK